MSQQVLPILGAVVGAFYGGPAGAQWGYMAGPVIGLAVAPATEEEHYEHHELVDDAREGNRRS